MPTTGPPLDAARRLVVERNLVRAAFDHLTDAFRALPFEALGPTKTLLKRFFSSEPWGPADDDALAAAVGPGEGTWQRTLDVDLSLEYGWIDGRFAVRVSSTAATPGPVSAPDGPPGIAPMPDDALAASFDGPVVPEATPNPRTIRFQVGPVNDGPSRWYETPEQARDEPSAARFFDQFAEVANVLVGPDFVAVGLRRPNEWERLLLPILSVVAEEYASPDGGHATAAPRVMGGPAGAGAGAPAVEAVDVGRRATRLAQAWRELRSVRPADPADLAVVRAAAASDDAARRQVAASLLREADAEVAAADWARLAGDPVRSVRRAAVDAMVDVGRQELRPLLERALTDTDSWVRWKALRGLAELGPARSRDAIAARADDPDFRVRLEAVAALRAADRLST
ncbi:MAG TPA: HEAT repeat domain-containing protein [Acidimicrobiia bacterium]|nr:HEAT repeat domain-containing protein [Acidimicrobiia bacterium]